MSEPSRRFSLRFLSGKHQDREYVLGDAATGLIGRGADVDLVLVEGMVSRHHARMKVEDDELVLEDLGSTNGTFVNGERISRRRLEEGDRVLIGTTIMKVIHSRAPLGTKPPPPARNEMADAETSRDLMAGDLEEVGVAEVIDMFGTARRSLLLQIDTSDDRLRISISDGVVLDCRSRKLQDAPAEKCIFRALGIERGSYSVLPFHDPIESRLEVAIPELLVAGAKKLDDLAVIRQRLPASGDRLQIARPLRPRLADLDPTDLDLLQVAHNASDVDDAMNATPLEDVEAARRLLALIDAGYLRRQT